MSTLWIFESNSSKSSKSGSEGRDKKFDYVICLLLRKNQIMDEKAKRNQLTQADR